MNIKKTEILIIGGGLTGLTLAYLLQQSNIKCIVSEANRRLGGRIKTAYNTDQAPIELGATWIIDQQTSVIKLLKDLNINLFEQFYGDTAIYHPNGMKNAQLVKLPKNDSKSYRVENGTYSIIDALLKKIGTENIDLSQKINSVELTENGIEAISDNTKYQCKYVVSTLPPLLFSTINTKPTLPEEIRTLLSKTHTWMHDSIRIGFTYKQAFWKTNNSSTIYSSVGPIQEFYDHSSVDGNLYALSGFMNGSYHDSSIDKRKNLALQQLQSYYGDVALNYNSYEECIWKHEKLTSINSESFLMPQTNNGHPLYKNSFLDNRLYIAGAETSSVFPGKMEGAITSTKYIFSQLKHTLQRK